MVVTSHLVGSLQGNDALFFPLVFLHIVAALAGFGSIGFAGTYASRAAQIAFEPAPTPAPATAPAAKGEEGANAEQGAGASDGPLGPRPEGKELTGPGTPPVQAAGERPGGSEAVDEGTAPDKLSEFDPETEEIMRYFQKPARFWPAILAVPVFGLLALWAQPRTGGLHQVWPLAALLVWTGAVLVFLSMVLPGLRNVRTMLLAHESRPEGTAAETAWRARLRRAGALAGRGAAVCDVLFFVALALMIWRP